MEGQLLCSQCEWLKFWQQEEKPNPKYLSNFPTTFYLDKKIQSGRLAGLTQLYCWGGFERIDSSLLFTIITVVFGQYPPWERAWSSQVSKRLGICSM